MFRCSRVTTTPGIARRWSSPTNMTERSVFATLFPTASLQLFPTASLQRCLFHVLRSMSREITLDKMGIRAGQRDALLAIFGAMASAHSEEVFAEQCELLEKMDVPAASDYFAKNWLPIKQQWVSCLKARHFTIGETTNNRLESFNAKVKSVCSRYASLDSFFSDFLAVLRVLRDERVHASTVTSISRIISTPYNMMEADLQYKDLLTSYAYEKVLLQIARRDAT